MIKRTKEQKRVKFWLDFIDILNDIAERERNATHFKRIIN